MHDQNIAEYIGKSEIVGTVLMCYYVEHLHHQKPEPLI